MLRCMSTMEIAQFLHGLARSLIGARGQSGLLAATLPPMDSGIDRALAAGSMRFGGRVLRSPLPSVTLRLASGVDAVGLADAWGIEAPIAVSGDVHQATWRIAMRGRALPDLGTRLIEVEDIVIGSWAVTALLQGRPRGDLPGVSAGASPVYDLRERGGMVRAIFVERVTPRGRLTTAGDPVAVRLLEAARGRNPFARPGWAPAADCPFVIISAGETPVAGAALVVDRMSSLALVSAVVIDPATASNSTGEDLVDVLEAVAFENGAGAIRFDGGAFLFEASLGLADRGYTVGPPYDGDSDADVWAEHRLDD